MAAPRTYPDELRERAVREVRATGRPVAHVARDLGIHPEALRGWVRQAEADSGDRDDRLTTSERDELKQLRKPSRLPTPPSPPPAVDRHRIDERVRELRVLVDSGADLVRPRTMVINQVKAYTHLWLTNLSRWSSTDLEAVAIAINNRPRKVLGRRTPAEVFEEQLRSLQQPGVATTG